VRTLCLASLATLLSLSLAACDTDSPDGGPGPGDPPAGWTDRWTPSAIFDESLPAFELRIDAADVAALEADPRTYVEATIVYGGEELGPVGVKVKGQNSFLPFSQKPSLRININEYVEDATLWGLKDLTLNNMSTDTSMMHERLAYHVARQADLPASRANHVQLTVNGQFYGLYMAIETVKRRMISEHFEDADGSLFEATDVDFQPAMVAGYVLEEGPNDRTKLMGLANALTNPDASAAIAAAAQYVDLAHFQRYWAVGTVIGQFDAFPYSLPGDDYFVYADPRTSKLWFLPWGMDETFFAADFPPMQINSVLAQKCLAAPACRQPYLAKVWEILAMTEAMNLEGERLRVQAEIAPVVGRDTRKPYDAAAVTEGQTQQGYFIRGRRQMLTMQLPAE
jgi:hypothetical protein